MVVFLSRLKNQGTFWAPKKKNLPSPEVALVDFSSDGRPCSLSYLMAVFSAKLFGHLTVILLTLSFLTLWKFRGDRIKWKWYLAWPFTILQNDNIMISWDFLRQTAPAAMPGHLGAVSLKKISWYHNIIIL